MRHNERMIMIDEDNKHYYKATTCYTCNTPFGDQWNTQRVRDHDHRTGAFMGRSMSKMQYQLLF